MIWLVFVCFKLKMGVGTDIAFKVRSFSWLFKTKFKGVTMVKLLIGVLMLAAVSFGEIITIDLPVDANGWDHKSASLISVNLEKYLTGTSGIIESASLNFTGIQNLREPENNDFLNISILQLNGASGADKYSKVFLDGVDNDNLQNAGNYFKTELNAEYTWVDGKSEVAGYTDNNDVFGYQNNSEGKAWLEYTWQPFYTQDVPAYQGTGWYYMDRMPWNPTAANDGHWWARVVNYKTEDFTRTLDVNKVADLMNLSNGWLGVGLDADCHYIGNVQLVVTTSTTNVPEPTILSLLGCSLLGLAFIRRKK